eukprot:TRINITY_DN47247_c0_g1_i1.p1 TRINITY_DN47247_c0_g1~~TRINITY_DN47247_c0_g1_i1.p1  ORF type:complete len:109 (+),score=27.11 TRINITY_DN47247_c0_g1_i1:103-429(+)
MIRRPPRSTLSSSSAASDVYKRQGINAEYGCRSHLHNSGASGFLPEGPLTVNPTMPVGAKGMAASVSDLVAAALSSMDSAPSTAVAPGIKRVRSPPKAVLDDDFIEDV